MTQKRLSQYRHICREIEQLGDDLEKLQRQQLHDSVLASDGPGYALREITIRGDTAAVKKLKSTLRQREQKLIRERTAIEDFIDSVTDSQMRQIIRMRFLEKTKSNRPMSWQAIAFRMGWTDESTPRQRFNNFMASRTSPKKAC